MVASTYLAEHSYQTEDLREISKSSRLVGRAVRSENIMAIGVEYLMHNGVCFLYRMQGGAKSG